MLVALWKGWLSTMAVLCAPEKIHTRYLTPSRFHKGFCHVLVFQTGLSETDKKILRFHFRICSSWSEHQADGLFHPDYPDFLNLEIHALKKCKLPEGVV